MKLSEIVFNSSAMIAAMRWIEDNSLWSEDSAHLTEDPKTKEIVYRATQFAIASSADIIDPPFDVYSSTCEMRNLKLGTNNFDWLKSTHDVIIKNPFNMHSIDKDISTLKSKGMEKLNLVIGPRDGPFSVSEFLSTYGTNLDLTLTIDKNEGGGYRNSIISVTWTKRYPQFNGVSGETPDGKLFDVMSNDIFDIQHTIVDVGWEQYA